MCLGKNPALWMNPIEAVVLYSFNGENPSELTIRAGQKIKIAPKEVQQMNRLLSTNWLLATADGQNVGLIPVNYIKRHESNQTPYINQNLSSQSESNQTSTSEPQVENIPISDHKNPELNEHEPLTSVNKDDH
jgi:Variant SH3 domain